MAKHVVLAIAFAAYCAVVIIGAVVHEPWWDEAQAWLVARDTPLLELFTREVRYEGHPPLWYLILAIPAKLGLPYWWLKVAGVVAGMVTVLLLLYGFPSVPLYVRVLAPFAFFIAYQYTVVARSYVLLGPLLLLIARMYDRRSERPGLFALLLILLSNVSVHGFAIACGLAGLYALDVILRRIPRPPMRTFLAAAAALTLSGVLLVLALWPPADNPSYVHHHSLLSPARHSQIVTTLVPALFWTSLEDDDPSVAVAKVAAALVALTLLVAWIFRSGAGAPFALSLLGAYGVSLRYFSMWHEGIFFLVLLFGAVLAFERHRAPRWLHIAGQLVLVLLLLRHARWTFQSLAYDIREQSTGSARAAEFIRAEGLDRQVLYGTGSSMVELQPYFASNIFDNYSLGGRAYWDWSSLNKWPYVAFTPESEAALVRFLDRILRDEPDFIVYGAGILEDKLYAPRLFGNLSYRHIGTFTGQTYWKSAPKWEIEYHVFERITPGPRSGTPRASAPRSDAR